MALRLLVLGNSHDTIDGGDGRATTMWRMAAALEQHTRETVDLRYVMAYPSPGLVRYAATVLDEFDPDIVLLHCSGHVVGPRSLPARMQHVLGPRQHAGYRRLVDTVRHHTGIDPLVAPSPTTRRSLLQALDERARNLLLGLGLGDSVMRVEEATAVYAAVIRLLAAREDLIVLVRGPIFSTVNAGIPRVQAVAEARITAFDRALAQQCATRRVPYCSVLAMDGELRPHLLPDGLHRGPAGHAALAAAELHHLPAQLTGATNARG